MTSRADLVVAIAKAERAVVAAEHLQGMTPAGMTRPLYPWEIRSHTDFAAMDQATTQAQQASNRTLDELRDVIISALVAAIASAGDEAAAVRALNAFAAAQPQAVRDQIRQATGQIHLILDDLYSSGADMVVREAVDQGVSAPDALAEGLAADPEAFTSHAAAPPMSVWQRLVGVALAVAGVRAASATQILSAVTDTPLDGAYDQARQATNLALGAGRIDAVQQLPEPDDVYSSEILDGATCDPCGNIDGTHYPDLQSGVDDYPSGPYTLCDGGDRCRGTLVFVWSGTSDTTDTTDTGA